MWNRFCQACRALWNILFPPTYQTLQEKLRGFMGQDLRGLETHDKTYPGYDLASIHSALQSFLGECCEHVESPGGSQAVNMRGLFEMFVYNPAVYATTPAYERVPIGVDIEASCPTNVLWLCQLKPESPPAPQNNGKPVQPGAPEPILVLLATVQQRLDYWDGMDKSNVPAREISLSIACRSRATADRFFHEVEERRKRLNVFRGKCIDPVLGAGGVYTVGFRPIQKVREGDLVLPDSLRQLLESSILGFYAHREVLTNLGVDLKRGVILHGPPGTGKTSISLYLAERLPQFTICFVSGDRLLYPRELCRMARYLQPTMIVFEDIDLVAHERQINGLATVLGELMNQIDGCEPTDQVLFVMNTNSLDRLEHAVKNRPGRVDQIIHVPLPERDERLRLLRYFARTVQLDDHLEEILDATEGTTPAMLKEIVKRAIVAAISRDSSSGGKVHLKVSDLLNATRDVRAQRDPEPVPGNFGFGERR